jgi:hypothetical protein
VRRRGVLDGEALRQRQREEPPDLLVEPVGELARDAVADDGEEPDLARRAAQVVEERLAIGRAEAREVQDGQRPRHEPA